MDEIPTILIVDALTDEVIEREMNADELAEHQALREATQAYQADQDAKASARTSALAKLAELGLTAEEIATL